MLLAELLAELQSLPEVLHSKVPELLPDFLATIFKEGDEQEAARSDQQEPELPLEAVATAYVHSCQLDADCLWQFIPVWRCVALLHKCSRKVHSTALSDNAAASGTQTASFCVTALFALANLPGPLRLCSLALQPPLPMQASCSTACGSTVRWQWQMGPAGGLHGQQRCRHGHCINGCCSATSVFGHPADGADYIYGHAACQQPRPQRAGQQACQHRP